jgi:hypothetical protein
VADYPGSERSVDDAVLAGTAAPPGAPVQTEITQICVIAVLTVACRHAF